MNRYTIALLVISLLVLASCASQDVSQPAAGVPFIGGNDGIEAGLIDGMPPAQVYDGNRMDFGIGVALENLGEADVGADTDNPYLAVEINGFPPAVFGFDAADLRQVYDRTLLGARKNFDGSILPGGLDSIQFEGLRYKGELEGDYIQNFLVETCYDYETIATVSLCFKKEIIENVQDAAICTLTGEKLPQNSGSPIHVTSVVQNPLGTDKTTGKHRIMVNIILEHVGTGDFYGRSRAPSPTPWSQPSTGENEETCDPSLTNTNKYRVDVELYPGSGSTMGIDCSSFDDSSPSRGMVTLFQGAPTTITCTLTDSGPEDRPYTDLLNIKLRYRYGESMIQPVVIKAVGTQN